ncbi:MAG: class I SAM-dependent methyltransferase [Ginsengibacter sp.]
MVKTKIFNRIVSFLIRKKPGWVDFFIKEVIFKFGFTPSVINDRKYFFQWEKKGYHISLNHFYHPIPNLSDLGENYWKQKSLLEGINTNLHCQSDLLTEFNEQFSNEFNAFPLYKENVNNPWEYYIQNHNFTSVDGEILYSMIRKYLPENIVEIGSGYSTFLISKALLYNKKCNEKYLSNFTSIEPYPREFFKTTIPLLDTIIEKPIQQVESTLFKNLKENDILFIDSTHVMKYGSDVEFELFNILPGLQKGVIIHFHDIFWPVNYPKKWVIENGWFWNEQHFLQSFLMYNDSFEILWSSSIMHTNFPSALADIFTSYSDKENPGSLWLRKIK